MSQTDIQKLVRLFLSETVKRPQLADSLRSFLQGLGFGGTAVAPAEPTLEDVFVTLVGR